MNFTQLFFVEACEVWIFQSFGAVFCGRFSDGGEARMGGSAAEFRGFWVARGYGKAIQHTADSTGVVGRKKILKIFKKGVENLKSGVREVPKGNLRGTLYRVRGAIVRRDF